MLPDARLGSWSTHVDPGADGDEIRVDGGRGCSGFAVEGADRWEGIAIDSSCSGMKILELARDAEDTEVIAEGGEG
jgi:hypothetical protein